MSAARSRIPRARVVFAFAALTFVLATPAAAEVEPYGADDAGGFRNILPPGENGVGNAVDLAAFLATGSYPDHWYDQQPIYDAQIGAVAQRVFGTSDVNSLFKDATFGVPEHEVESTIHPRPGATIVRDSEFGVPHVYGFTREDTMFGVGYANAADRLFLIDVLRHVGHANLSSFAGGTETNLAMDRAQWKVAPYLPGELEAQAAAAPEVYGKAGEKLLADLDAYIAGINAYVADALVNPTLLPGEYAAIGRLPVPWTRGDVIATASLIAALFGKGGGAELDSARTLQAIQKRFGKREGRRVWLDFRSKEDPEAPTTLTESFPYQSGSPFSKRGLALPDPGSVDAPFVGGFEAYRAPAEPPGPADAIAAAILDEMRDQDGASHWELISAGESESGHPIAVMGPQVDYYIPQILLEIDVHGPGIEARGAAFPGVGLYVLLGHGRDYAWSATTAYADNVDTFAEVLCRDDTHYRYKGRCLKMDTLVRENSWTPNASISSAGSETLTVHRTVHGLVIARGRVDGKKVAFVQARSTYMHEAESALFFSRLNNPQKMRDGAPAFLRAADTMNLVFNWAYVDSENIAMKTTGWFPRRAPGVSPDFPVLGTGRFDWRGFDPKTNMADYIPPAEHPQAVDPEFLVSWNNKQAPEFTAADDQYAFGPVYRSEMIADKIRRLIRGSRKASLPELVKQQGLTATQDVRGVELLPIIIRAIGKPSSPKLAAAIRELRNWHRSGAHRRDLDGDGVYDDDRAITIMDAWWPRLLAAEFEPTLGKKAFDYVRGMVGFGGPGFKDPEAPAFSDGWYGYVDKDLRTLFGKRPEGAYSRIYCGRGSEVRCRAALRRSLKHALDVPKSKIYGYDECESDPQASCWDKNRSIEASGITIDPMPFQNRPTFQQTIAVERDVPPKR